MFNAFGATAASCMNLFASNASDYGDADNLLTDAGGLAAVEMDMADIEEEIVSTMCQDVYRGLIYIKYEDVTLDATKEGYTFPFGVNPVDTSKPITVWRWESGAKPFPLNIHYAQEENTDYTISTDTSDITSITMDQIIERGTKIFVSYHPLTSSSSYSVKSLAMILEIGVASRIGSRLYSEGTPSWDLVTYYRTRYGQLLEKITDCSYIPSNIRHLSFHRPIDNESAEAIVSVPIFRS